MLLLDFVFSIAFGALPLILLIGAGQIIASLLTWHDDFDGQIAKSIKIKSSGWDSFCNVHVVELPEDAQMTPFAAEHMDHHWVP